MRPLRRKADKCIAVRLYNDFTPYVQVMGWLSVVTGIIWAASATWSRVDASILSHDTRLGTIEHREDDTMKRLERVEGKLDIIIEFHKAKP